MTLASCLSVAFHQLAVNMPHPERRSCPSVQDVTIRGLLCTSCCTRLASGTNSPGQTEMTFLKCSGRTSRRVCIYDWFDPFTPRSDLLVILLYNTRAMLGRKITRRVTLWTRSYLYSLEWHQMLRFKICMKCVADNTKIAIDRIILIVVAIIIIILITIPNSYTRQLQQRLRDANRIQDNSVYARAKGREKQEIHFLSFIFFQGKNIILTVTNQRIWISMVALTTFRVLCIMGTSRFPKTRDQPCCL